MTYGIGSKPPGIPGRQRHTRPAASLSPSINPCLAKHSAAYIEQLGSKRQAPPSCAPKTPRYRCTRTTPNLPPSLCKSLLRADITENSQFPQLIRKDCAQVAGAQERSGLPSNHHDIERFCDASSFEPEPLANPALHPVPDHGIPNPAADGNTETAARRSFLPLPFCFGRDQNHHCRARNTPAAELNSAELRRAPESVTARKTA